MNCLVYRYWYRSKFYNWLPEFLEKVQTICKNQNFIIFVAGIFVIFLFPCNIVVMPLPYLSSDDSLIFFCLSFCGALGLLLCLKSKKHNGSDSFPSLMGNWNYHKSYLLAYLCQNFWVNG